MDINKEVADTLSNPDKQIEFIERMYGEQLSTLQKRFIKFLIKNKDKGIYFNYPYRNGRTSIKRFLL
ncbi:hypothetical protein [Paenibacillus xylaniclasticus]|uniref:hypothetical protein n=1 Tax=Paenibacillus xylaniclasticus TaxID=588083 RepID=UPI000FD6DADE|nr:MULTISPECIES: hypothetical protein [Paenibacillus]GFN32469.1 hypothetical protein PCURB6_27290 [Paenibacillus curdlanolyticus]